MLESTINLDPETIQTVELVFDYLPTRNLRTILNIFHYRIEDLISFDQATPQWTRAKNSGSQAGQGFEFETKWSVSPTVLLRCNTDAREPSLASIADDYPLEGRSFWGELRTHF